MLHIHNGDSSAETLKKSNLPGEHFAFREALIDGPTPLHLSAEEWRKLRAHHLAGVYDIEEVWTETELFKQEQKLNSFPEYEEVILWFEHDLFCQVNLLYLLNWFGECNLGSTKLSLICIGEFPGRPDFRGLGELNFEQMASLFDGRHEVSAEENRLATDAWQAYCSPDPTAIEKLLATDTSAMPFLKPALQLHLQRFPFVRNGLGRIQNRGLEFIHGGMEKFVDLFPRFGKAEPVYGLGDTQFWNALRRMSDARKPLLRVRNGEETNANLSPEKIHESAFDITTTGESVLKGEADFVELNGIDQWLGGVHLVGKRGLWRWDEQTSRLRQV